MKKVQPGDVVTYNNEEHTVKAVKKNFLNKKYYVLFEDTGNEEFEWPEPNRQFEDLKEIKEIEDLTAEEVSDTLEQEVEEIEEETLEEEEVEKPKIKRKKKSSKK